MGQIKIVRKIMLPLVVDQKVRFIRDDGMECETTPRIIDGILCKEKGLEVTFTTDNSTYRGLVPMTSKVQEYILGQEFSRGKKVVNTYNEQEVIESVREVREDGILIRTKNGLFKGLVKLS
jgi:hypothetical protein